MAVNRIRPIGAVAFSIIEQKQFVRSPRASLVRLPGGSRKWPSCRSSSWPSPTSKRDGVTCGTFPTNSTGFERILKNAERNGLCRLELLPNATLDQIFDVFTRNRDQVTILHYAGHADSGRLLLESSAVGGAPAHAAGLATFLGQCGGLQLVFLNGCSTRAQVARLLEAGVSAVIATARAINDGMAREFAVAFYTELAAGLPLRAAYEKARGRMLAAHDTVPEAYYGHRDLGTTSESAGPDSTDDHGFPWEFRPGTELVERWSLPDAAGNPEFGLPRLPERNLPESPFRHLNWFRAEDAEVFFGRGYHVREMYEEIVDSAGPPILLLYGASGVGKSSLLDAGLVPRLEAGGRAVRYRRRDEKRGLWGSLRDAFQLTAEPTTLDLAWRAEEARLDKPLVVFLDQVEEVFTRPDPAQPRELDEFLSGLTAVMCKRETRPQGKLVLGFRKEWLAELDRRLAEAKLPRTPVFLKPLDRRGIIGAIRGPARPGRLQRQYRLAIEDGLPEVIAEDLLADAGSALSSTLQVLLTKMWECARQANPDQPRFDRVLYESLKAEGYLLKDVLDEGLRSIGRWRRAVEDSGLALDVLVYHTTDLGTAAQCTRAELTERYAHQVASVDGLLGQCKDHYLIVEAESSPESTNRSTRLAHDLLAALVQQRFRLSLAPGQRARRLLENRAPEWRDGKIGPVLDGTDLSTVEEGASGMRVWNAEEIRLVEASRYSKEQQNAEEAERVRRLHEAEEGKRHAEIEKQMETEQRLKEQEESNRRLRRRAYALGGILALTVCVALLAANLWLAADKATGIANEKTQVATKATEDAEKAAKKEADEAKIAREQTRLAEDRLKTATSRQLAALSELERPRRLDRSLHLAFAAFRAANTLEAREALFKGLQDRPTIRSFLQIDDAALSRTQQYSAPFETIVLGEGNDGSVASVAFSTDGKILAAGYRADRFHGGVILWDVMRRRRLVEDALPVPEGQVGSVALSPKGKILAAGYYNDGGTGGVVLWDVSTRGRLMDHSIPVKGNVRSVAFSPDGSMLAAAYHAGQSGGGLVFFDVAARKDLVDKPLPVIEGKGSVGSVVFSPNGNTVAAGYFAGPGGGGGGIVLWDVATRTRIVKKPLPVPEGVVGGVAFSRDGNILAAGCSFGAEGGGLVLFDVASGNRLVDKPLLVPEGVVWGTAFSPDGKAVAVAFRSSERGGVVLFDVASRARLLNSPLTINEGSVWDVAYSPDGKTIAAGYNADRRGGVVLWDAVARMRLVEDTFDVGLKVESVAFSRDERTIAAGCTPFVGYGGSVVLWDALDRRLVGKPLTVSRPSLVPTITRTDCVFQSVAFSPDGKTIAAGYTFNGPALSGVVLTGLAEYERLTNDPILVKEGGIMTVAKHSVQSVSFSPDGKIIAAGCTSSVDYGGGVFLWDAVTRQPLTTDPLTLGEGKFTDVAVAFSPDSKTLAARYGGDTNNAFGGETTGGGVVLWDLAKRERPITARLPVLDVGFVRSLAFSLDGETLAAGYAGDRTSGGGVVLWDLAKRERQLDRPAPRSRGLRPKRGIQPRRQDPRRRIPVLRSGQQ